MESLGWVLPPQANTECETTLRHILTVSNHFIDHLLPHLLITSHVRIQILRDTYNMLQRHPHPDGFADESKPCHYYYFTGLLRNRQAQSEASEPFDIRSTVEEFKFCVSMYIMWKPGMEIYVSHVKRKNVPAFVFPGGVRSPGPSKEDGVDRKES